MAIIKSFSPFQNLSNFNVFLEDNDPNSEYFRITEFQETFTGGKNGFLIEGSEFLKPTTEVKLELLDVEGNPIFFIPGEGIPEYYEGVSKLVSVHVYEDTPIGQGKITILGELERYIDDQGIERDVPDEWKGVYNVKWERTFRVNKNLNNETIVRFVNRPQAQIDEIVKPFFVKDIPQITQTGNASGLGENPVEGTNLTGYTAGTLYRLAITDDTNFAESVDENVITFPNLDYSSTVREVLNNKEVLVDVPYTENNIVTNFQNQFYTTTFEDLESQSTVESALTGSFAKIKLNRLKTFVGDVARVKVFRKSRNEVGDFQLVQDARIESTELLRDITVQDDTEVFYGNFTQNILDTYWVSGSDDHPISLDDTKLFGAIQVDYNEGIGGTQAFSTSESFEIEDDVEYTVSFKTIFDGTPTTDKFVRVSLSGSNYEQVISTTIPSASFNTRQDITQNFIATTSSLDAKLQFEFVGADWYVSKVSLKNAQETSFSPDELTLIQDVPRRLPQETFDFRFEFYDVNNNFIPVSVTATKEFVGGNDFRTEQKLFTFESDRTAFRFITGSLGNPSFQQIRFSNTIQNLTGSVLYTSQAFDIDGNLITSESYHDSGVLEYPGGFSGSYPGLLLNPGNDGATLPIANFSGSVSGVTVGSIIYTASLESRQEFETIFRFEDGEDAPALIVTSNTNQFIYEPTQLRPKPLGQEVRIKAQRKNLASLTSPITVNSGSDNPPLTEEVDVNGIKEYSISANAFSSSFSGSDGVFPEVTYEFTSSDEFLNEFTDEITVSPVINFDGLSVVLSNETTAFRANSQGLILDDFESGDGEVEIRIGGSAIEHSEGLDSRNTFDIISVTGTNVTPKSTAPTTNEYGITNLTADSGFLVLNIKYLAGDNATSQSFTKKVNYTKNRISPPAITISTSNKSQNVSAKSTGEQIENFDNALISVQENYTGSVTTFGSDDVSISFVSNPNDIATDNGNLSFTFNNLADEINSSRVLFTATVTDSEGQSREVSDTISLSKSTNAVPTVLTKTSPSTQTINSSSEGFEVPQDVEVIVQEGGVEYGYQTGLTGGSDESLKYEIISVSSGSNNNDGTITPIYGTSPSYNGTIGSASLNYVDSEGTLATDKLVRFDISVSKVGVDGPPGESGSNAVNINITPTSQVVKLSTAGEYADPIPFVISVVEDGTPLTHTTSSLANSEFEITNLSNGSLTSGGGTTIPEITPTTPTTVGGITTSFDITYKTSAGKESSPLPQQHVVSVVLDGVTGPGVVHTGVWETGRIYQFDDGLLTGTGRRDTVLWSSTGSGSYDTYYATKRTHTSDENDTTQDGNGPPHIATDTWVSLGTEDFFVAAKIGIFEDSFIQNTLNIGTNNQGGFDAANITLFGGDEYPYFSLGQDTAGTYGADGIFIGNDGGNYRMSLKGDNGSLEWDGDALTITGSGDFSGSITATDGQIGGWSIGENSLIGGDLVFTIGLIPGTGIHLGNTDFDNSPFRVTKHGEVISTSGSIGGITIADEKLHTGIGDFGDDNTGFYVDSDGQFSLKDKLTWNGTDLTVTGSGTFTGTITATAGEIGGFSITDNSISSSNEELILRDNGQITGSLVLFDGGTIGGFNISENTISSSNENLILRANGEITGSAAQISGTINATAGSIGGFEIQSLTITGSQSTVALDSGIARNDLKKEGNNKLSSAQDAYGFYINDYNYFEAVTQDFTGNNGIPVFRVGDDSEYMLMNNGELTILSSNFELLNGSITATDGEIGGWSIGSNTLTSGNITLDAANNKIIANGVEFGDNLTGLNSPGIKVGDVNFWIIDENGNPRFRAGAQGGNRINIQSVGGQYQVDINADTFNLTSDGLTLNSSTGITTTQGTIGGFTIGDHTLTTDGFTIGDDTQTFAINASDNFTVTHDGTITASAANITGTITATDGDISGDLDVSGELQVGNSVRIGVNAEPPSVTPITQSVSLSVQDTYNSPSTSTTGQTLMPGSEDGIAEIDLTITGLTGPSNATCTLSYDGQSVQFDVPSSGIGTPFSFVGRGNQNLTLEVEAVGPGSLVTVTVGGTVIARTPPISLNSNGLFTTNKLGTVVPLLSLLGGGASSTGGGGGTMSSFALSDGTSSQTIEDGDTLTIAGGTGITTTVTSTDTASIEIDTQVVPVLTGSNTFAGNQAAPNFVISSDRRLKTDLVPITSGIEKISQLHPFEYTKNSVREIGIIAQDLEKVSPASVHENKDGYKVVDTMALSTLNLSAIKELIQQFVYLEERVKKLENK